MNRKLKLISLVVILATACLTIYNLQKCWAAFEDIGVGARPLGMGNAFCAVADDANAFLYNPAGLTQIEKIQVSAMYANLYPSLSDKSSIANNYLAVAYPSEVGTIGFSWFNLTVGSDPQRAKATYIENTYILSYAVYLEFLSLGFSAKLHTKEYGVSYWTIQNPVFADGMSAFGVGIDIGILYKLLRERLSVGLFLSDINSPNLQLKTNSPIPMTARFGIGYKMLPVWAFEDIIAAADLTLRDGDIKCHSGLEAWLGEGSIGLRFGLGFGTNSYGSISAGASYKLTEEIYNNDFRLDYAFIYPLSGLQPTGGTHRFSLTMGFGL